MCLSYLGSVKRGWKDRSSFLVSSFLLSLRKCALEKGLSRIPYEAVNEATLYVVICLQTRMWPDFSVVLTNRCIVRSGTRTRCDSNKAERAGILYRTHRLDSRIGKNTLAQDLGISQA